jgi:hypothetical protein
MVAYLSPVDPNTHADLLGGDDVALEQIGLRMEDEVATGTVDLDKAWHGIHFLLTGSADGDAPPLAWAVLGGEEIGEDMGYGPARFLTADRVRAVAEALPADEAFLAAFDGAAMDAADVYPGPMWSDDDDQPRRYLLDAYHRLVAFYRSAAARGDAALLWLA